MPANYSAIWKDCGFLGSTPPCLVVPYEGLSLVCLNGVRPFDVNRDLNFDRTNLTVKVVTPASVLNQLMTCAENFPQSVSDQILALGGNVRNLIQYGSPVLSVEGGISISEDPNIRFTYVSNGAKTFRAEAKDTDGHQFRHEWKVNGFGM